MGRSKKVARHVIGDRRVFIDHETGQVLKEENEYKIFYEKEDGFIKIYYRTIFSAEEVDDLSLGFIMCISEYIGYANGDGQMMLYTNGAMKKKIAERLNISVSVVNKRFQRCVEEGILFKTDERSEYIVNPFIIAKGEWKNIKKLQCCFDFIDGKWTMVKELKREGDE